MNFLRIVLLLVTALLLALASRHSEVPRLAAAGAICALLAALVVALQALMRRDLARDGPVSRAPRIYSVEHVGPGVYRRPECPTPTCVQPVDCRASDRCMSLPIKRINP